MSVVIETTVGDLTVDLYTKLRPRTCLNFLKLCKIKYYNLCLFHSIQRGFTAQTGDPEGTGRGGASVFMQLYGEQAKYFEMETSPKLKHQHLGTLSMVNNGSDMHGSQFFLTLGENQDYLDEKHTVFGVVAEGLDTLLKISEAICDEQHKPYKDIRITHTVILEDPFDDPSGIIVPPMSPVPTKDLLESGRIRVDEEIDDKAGKTTEEIEEEIKEKEARARATILEIIGDIPDADVRPPDNVLFVCKLNPVTTDEDLEIIFSRFGKISSCEIIRDHKTSDSLQYGFIEFEDPKCCEDAYFKMDNVLIDDRRIHVDFSQSVSKIKWKGKGKGVEHINEEIEVKKQRPRDYTDKRQDPPNKSLIAKLKENIKKDEENERREITGKSINFNSNKNIDKLSNGKEKNTSKSQSPHLKNTKSQSPKKTKRRSTSRSKHGGRRRSRSRSGSRDRRRRKRFSRSRSKSRSRSRSYQRRSRSRSKSSKRSRSRSRSRSRRRSRSRSSRRHSRSRSRSRSRDRRRRSRSLNRYYRGGGGGGGGRYWGRNRWVPMDRYRYNQPNWNWRRRQQPRWSPKRRSPDDRYRRRSDRRSRSRDRSRTPDRRSRSRDRGSKSKELRTKYGDRASKSKERVSKSPAAYKQSNSNAEVEDIKAKQPPQTRSSDSEDSGDEKKKSKKRKKQKRRKQSPSSEDSSRKKKAKRHSSPSSDESDERSKSKKKKKKTSKKKEELQKSAKKSKPKEPSSDSSSESEKKQSSESSSDESDEAKKKKLMSKKEEKHKLRKEKKKRKREKKDSSEESDASSDSSQEIKKKKKKKKSKR